MQNLCYLKALKEYLPYWSTTILEHKIAFGLIFGRQLPPPPMEETLTTVVQLTSSLRGGSPFCTMLSSSYVLTSKASNFGLVSSPTASAWVHNVWFTLRRNVTQCILFMRDPMQLHNVSSGQCHYYCEPGSIFRVKAIIEMCLQKWRGGCF